MPLERVLNLNMWWKDVLMTDILACPSETNETMIIAQCAVCQELLESGSENHLSVLHCGHVFHAICIETWFTKALTCPQCRVAAKRAQVVKRVYFCTVDQASTSMLLPGVESTQSSDEKVSYH